MKVEAGAVSEMKTQETESNMMVMLRCLAFFRSFFWFIRCWMRLAEAITRRMEQFRSNMITNGQRVKKNHWM